MQRLFAAPCVLFLAGLGSVALANEPSASDTPAVAPFVASVAPALQEPDPLGALMGRIPGLGDDAGLTAPPPPRDIWERIRRGFGMPELDTPLAEQRTRWYAGQPEYIARMSKRASRYLYHIVEEVEARGMPTELALLPFVESAFQPEAHSVAKAAGLWQFIPSTGKDFDLTQNMWKDERRDVLESTRAALDYFQKLYNMFGDWHLALAAYNWGEGSVSRAIERNRRAGKDTSYLDLRMPNETQHYVPKLQAIKNIVASPEAYGLTLPTVENEPYFVRVDKERDIDVKTAARLAEMKLEDFVALNPSFNRPVIVASHNTPLLLPADKVDVFTANLAAWKSTGQALSSWTVHRVRDGETLASIARRVGIPETQLRDANRIPSRYKPAVGSTLLIPRDETMEEDIPAASADAQLALLPEQQMRRITYRVRKGDTVASVAARWKVSPKDVIAWNSLTRNSLFAGQRLTLSVPYTPKSNIAKKGGGSTQVAKAKRSGSSKVSTGKSERRTAPKSTARR